MHILSNFGYGGLENCLRTWIACFGNAGFKGRKRQTDRQRKILNWKMIFLNWNKLFVISKMWTKICEFYLEKKIKLENDQKEMDQTYYVYDIKSLRGIKISFSISP